MSADFTDLARCERCGYERQACDCPRCADCGSVWDVSAMWSVNEDLCADCAHRRGPEHSLSLTDFDPPRPQDSEDEYEPIDDATAEQIIHAMDEDEEP